MIFIIGAAIGAAAGGLLGGVGSFFAAQQDKKNFRTAQAGVRGGVELVRGGSQSITPEQAEALRSLARSLGLPETFAGGGDIFTPFQGGLSGLLTQAALQSPEFQASRSFLLNTLRDPLSSPTARNFRGGFRQAQADRGLFFSPAGAADEATRLSGLAGQLQFQALPQLLNLVGFGTRFQQSIEPFLLEREIRGFTGGTAGFGTNLQQPTSPFAASIAGALGGAQAGFQSSQLFELLK